MNKASWRLLQSTKSSALGMLLILFWRAVWEVKKGVGNKGCEPGGCVACMWLPCPHCPLYLQMNGPFHMVLPFLPLPKHGTPGPRGQGSREGGWDRVPHHILLQHIYLPVLHFDVIKESVYAFQMYLSNKPNPCTRSVSSGLSPASPTAQIQGLSTR